MAGHGELKASTQCKPIDCRDVRLAGLCDPVKEQIVAALCKRFALLGAVAGKLCNVGARHKALGARARNHHYPNLVVGVQLHHLLVQRLDRGGV